METVRKLVSSITEELDGANGADLDFLKGASGPVVKRDSH